MQSMHVTETYKAREIRFLEFWESDSWRVKVYGITYAGCTMPDAETMETAKVVALNRLSKLAPGEHHGLAFAIIHMARGADFVLLDWGPGNMFYSKLFLLVHRGSPAS